MLKIERQLSSSKGIAPRFCRYRLASDCTSGDDRLCHSLVKDLLLSLVSVRRRRRISGCQESGIFIAPISASALLCLGQERVYLTPRDCLIVAAATSVPIFVAVSSAQSPAFFRYCRAFAPFPLTISWEIRVPNPLAAQRGGPKIRSAKKCHKLLLVGRPSLAACHKSPAFLILGVSIV
jgi:hypothetical protein